MGKACSATRLGVIGREQHGLADKEAWPVQTHKVCRSVKALSYVQMFTKCYTGAPKCVRTLLDTQVPLKNV